MYYVIESMYVGPDPCSNQNVDKHYVNISAKPARGNNGRGRIITIGWVDTVNDILTYAHGEYETLDNARSTINRLFPETRKYNYGFGDPPDNDVIETYYVGRFAPMSKQSVQDFLYVSLRKDVAADTTDEQLDALAAQYERIARWENHMTLGGQQYDIIYQRRDELRAEHKK